MTHAYKPVFSIHDYPADDGARLRYGVVSDPERLADSRRALMFVPGLGGSIKLALEFLEYLLPIYNPIYGVDLRGFGLNIGPEPLLSPASLMSDLKAFMRHVPPAPGVSWTLGGLSLGGALSTLLAVERPQAFDGLFLLAPAYKGHPAAFPLPYKLKAILGVLTQGKKYPLTLPYNIEWLTKNEKILSDPQYWQPNAEFQLTAGYMLALEKITQRAAAQARHIKLPTMMVIPGKDRVCHPDAMRRGFNSIPQSTPKYLKEYPLLLHDVLLEAEHPEIARDFMAWAEKLALNPAAEASLSSKY